MKTLLTSLTALTFAVAVPNFAQAADGGSCDDADKKECPAYKGKDCGDKKDDAAGNSTESGKKS